MSASRAKALQALAEPIVAASDCDLEDVVIRPAGRRLLVRLVVDHRDGALTLDLVASISRDLARVLDDSTVLGQAPYVLEVTSPGVDRPLRTARHWHRAVGRIVLVTPTDGEPLEGRVLAADDTRATLDVDGEPRVVEFARRGPRRGPGRVHPDRRGGARRRGARRRSDAELGAEPSRRRRRRGRRRRRSRPADAPDPQAQEG